jgi:16S rRNA C967 or C1407 C5-methylase (RsmB/RsmF family)
VKEEVEMKEEAEMKEEEKEEVKAEADVKEEVELKKEVEGKEKEEGGKQAVVATPPHTHEHPLELCMRFLPHHQDTGGFFVAVLEKVRDCTDLVVPQNKNRAAKRDANGRAKRV